MKPLKRDVIVMNFRTVHSLRFLLTEPEEILIDESVFKSNASIKFLSHVVTFPFAFAESELEC